MDFVPEGYAEGGYVPEGSFFIPSAPSVTFIPRVDAEQLETEALAAIDEIKAALEEEETPAPVKPKRTRKKKSE